MKTIVIVIAIVFCAVVSQAQSFLQPYPNQPDTISSGRWIPDEYPITAPRGGYATQPIDRGPTYYFDNNPRDNAIRMETPAGSYTFGGSRLWED